MKKKNEGFTLIELVIAIVILAIAVSPLVSNFIQSNRININARKELNALNLAQDIMEGMSQYSVSQNTVFFDDAAHASGAAAVTDALVKPSILPKNTGVGNCTIIPVPGTTIIKYNLTGVETVIGKRYNNYDVTVSYDPSKTALMTYFNSKEMADIEQIDSNQDVVFTMPEDDEATLNGIRTELANKSTKAVKPAADQLKGKVARELTLEITKSAIAGSNPVKYEYAARIIRTYKVKKDNTTLGIPATAEYKPLPLQVALPSNSKMPRSVYLYFEGWASDTSMNVGSDTMDSITVDNQAGDPLTAYLFRTIYVDPAWGDPVVFPGDVVTYNRDYYACNVYVKAPENAYKCTNTIASTNEYGTPITTECGYRITEPVADFSVYRCPQCNSLIGSNKRADYATDIVSNIRYDLTEKNNTVSTYYRETRSKVYFNGTEATTSSPTYEEHVSDGYRKNKKALLYQVDVEIREHAADGTSGNVLATYTGGITN